MASFTNFLVYDAPRYSPLIILAALGVALLVEWRFPRREAPADRWARWVGNVGLAVLGIVLMDLVWDPLRGPVVAAGGALQLVSIARLPLPGWLIVVLSFLLLDFLQYASHMLFHVVPWFWRLHKIHHSDAHFDGSTGIRHHPLEALAGTIVSVVCYAALGLPLIVIALYSVVMSVHAVLSHANLRLPIGLDRVLRWVIVTPDMHRVHHSARVDEGNRNFGMLLPWWDRLLATYQAQPVDGHETGALGLAELQAAPRPGFLALLLLPVAGRRRRQAAVTEA